MNEWFLLIYPAVLFAYLMLAARWQPKGSANVLDDRMPGHPRRGLRPQH